MTTSAPQWPGKASRGGARIPPAPRLGRRYGRSLAAHRGYRSRCGHRLILDDSKKTKVVFADKTTKNMIGLGEFDKDGAGPNVCAVWKPPMSGTTGVSFSTMEGKMEITCKNGKLSMEAQQNIKMNAKTTIDVKAGKDITVEGSSAAKVTSGSPGHYDAPSIEIA